jgi:hypothetical protein
LLLVIKLRLLIFDLLRAVFNGVLHCALLLGQLLRAILDRIANISLRVA